MAASIPWKCKFPCCCAPIHNVRIVPLLIAGGWSEAGGRRNLREIGAAIAQTVQEFGKPVLLLASTDLNHYEDQEISHYQRQAGAGCGCEIG